MRLTLILVVLLFPVQAFAADYAAEISAFFELYEKGQRIEAVDRLYETNEWMQEATESISKIKTQLNRIEEAVGTYNGKVLVDEATIKDRFVHVTYLALYDRQPVRMEFQFYRPKSDWIIYSFAFDIGFAKDFGQGARASLASGK